MLDWRPGPAAVGAVPVIPPQPGEVRSLCRRIYPVQGESGLAARQAALLEAAAALRDLETREAIRLMRRQTGCSQDAATLALRRARRRAAW